MKRYGFGFSSASRSRQSTTSTLLSFGKGRKNGLDPCSETSLAPVSFEVRVYGEGWVEENEVRIDSLETSPSHSPRFRLFESPELMQGESTYPDFALRIH